MEKNLLKNDAYLLSQTCDDPNQKDSLLIVPSSAGYNSQYKSVVYKDHIDAFCKRLSAKYGIYYLVLPGQDPKAPLAKYSYEASVSATLDAMKYIVNHGNLVAVIGMCTGGAIASQAMEDFGKYFPLVLYSSGVWAGWATPSVQKMFEDKYKNVTLDKEALLKAPTPGDVIAKHKGKILQILAGSTIPYPLVGTPDRPGQTEMKEKNPLIKQVLFQTMIEVPLQTSPEYEPMINEIFSFIE